MTDNMPLFPDEKLIALAVMGSIRAKDWPAKARYLEDKHGLPRVDELMGGRFWPAVLEFFNARHGQQSPTQGPISSSIRVVPPKLDGKEDYSRPRALDAHADAALIRTRMLNHTAAKDEKVKAASMTKRERDVLADCAATSGQYVSTDGHRRRAVRWLELHGLLEVKFEQRDQFARITPAGEAEWRRLEKRS